MAVEVLLIGCDQRSTETTRRYAIVQVKWLICRCRILFCMCFSDTNQTASNRLPSCVHHTHGGASHPLLCTTRTTPEKDSHHHKPSKGVPFEDTLFCCTGRLNPPFHFPNLKRKHRHSPSQDEIVTRSVDLGPRVAGDDVIIGAAGGRSANGPG